MLESLFADVRFSVRWWLRGRQDRIWTYGSLAVARRLPRWLRYWVTIDSIARATTGKYGTTVVPELTAMEVLERI
jgi:hypothetical protein